ncbi:sporulation protein YqfD [Desulforamulus hydrothermalis]|uniref:Putative stage IV sporulation YqfD n=1 Tax=Desulforamulus hydrothermalis Lam5 = DSM 18033 TaxID=1121428 RepID=K8E0J8_9FIRM|nr:sporulation protein YqfD [Desulforamulus hydrothermalis]CCO09097.1 putative stage IV sporulation YqfD [Desulforamulus hydrothermalis Lam5 = DSM 18033]SHH12627.1 similar to stage IV sporulation protein [Desulforamulus hydrothermalis Lam5 = DSM 18033]
MVLLRLFSFLLGHVSLVVRGEFLEKFVNLAASRGIYLWDITRLSEDKVRVKARISDIRSLKQVARTTHSGFKIVERRGLPFLINSLKKRKLLAIGGVIFLAILYFLSSFVWFIEITGHDKLSAAEIKQIAAQAGLRPGVAKWQLDTKQVETTLREKLPSLAWAGVYVKGTKVIIEVAEKKLVQPEPAQGQPAHIIAGKAGLIKEVLVLEGQAMVNEGDTVLPGSVLISGEIIQEIRPEAGNQPLPPGQEPPPPQTVSRFVQAKGIVRARVWYEGYGECKFSETVEKLSGQQKTSVRIKFGPKEIIIAGPAVSPYRYYQTSQTVKSLPKWRNLAIPVEVTTVNYLEVIKERVNHGRAGAQKIAEQKALAAVKAKLPQGAKLVEQRLEQVNTGRGEDLVRIKAFVETIEDIGVVKPFQATKEDYVDRTHRT